MHQQRVLPRRLSPCLPNSVYVKRVLHFIQVHRGLVGDAETCPHSAFVNDVNVQCGSEGEKGQVAPVMDGPPAKHSDPQRDWAPLQRRFLNLPSRLVVGRQIISGRAAGETCCVLTYDSCAGE